MLDEAGLEDFLSKEAPDFSLSLSEIEQDKALRAEDIHLSDSEQELAEEVELWQNSKGLKKIAYKIFRFLPRLSLRFKKLKFRLFAFSRAQWVRFKNFSYFLATDGKTRFFTKVKAFLFFFVDRLSESFRKFKAKPLKIKLLAVGILFFAAGTFFFIYKSVTKGVIHEDGLLFIPSLAAVASHSYQYDPMTETEYFYDNLKTNQNLLLLRKIFVNLKVSEKSGPNPMAAFEFYVEGSAPEAIIEVKDREGFIVDTVQRSIEEFTFESLEVPEGKQILLEKLKGDINSILTTGTIKKVLIKNVVLKP